MYTYRIYLDGGNLVIGTYESNVLKGEAKHLPRGLVAIAGNTNTTITINRVVNNLSTLTNIEHPNLRDGGGNVWGATRTAVIAAINSFIQSTGGGNVISVNGQTGTVSLGLQNLANVTTITPTQGDVLSYNSSGNWVLNSGLQYLLSKVKSATATQTSLEVDSNYKINIDSSQNKTTIVHNGTSVATFGAKTLLPAVTIGTAGTTYDLPAARGTADGQVPVFNVTDNTTSFQAVKVADLSGNTDDLTQGATNLFFTSAEQSKLAGIQSGAEVNVNADWNSSSGDSQILNKPTLSTVATSGSYNDLSNLPAIPAAYTDSDVDAHLNTATATTGQILSWTGSDYDWVLDAAGAPAGTVGQLQYNNSGIFGASSNLFWDISNSRLGIGTTTPADLLTVNGNARILNGNRLEFRSTSNTYGARHFLSDSQYRIGTDGANGWSGINISDNNGILLFLSGGHSWRGINDAMIGSKNIQAPSNGYFGFQSYASTNEYLAIKNARVDGNNEGLAFYTRLAGVNSETMRIAHSGNVGIGTTTPANKLQVAGDIGFTDGATRYIKLANRTVAGNGNNIIIEASNANTSGTGGSIYLYEGTGAGGPGPGTIFIGKSGGDSLSCSVNGRLEVGASGPNVGTALRVNAGGIQSFAVSWDNINGFRGYGLGTVQSRFLNSTSYTFDNNLLIGTNTNSTYKLDVNGSARIQTDLTVSGNVGIGTTTPSEKLHVVGNGKFVGQLQIENSYGNLGITTNNVNVTGYGNTLIGVGSTITDGNESTIIGNLNTTSYTNTITIGRYNNTVAGAGNIIIGKTLKANGTSSVIMGYNQSAGSSSVSINSGSVGDQSVGISSK